MNKKYLKLTSVVLLGFVLFACTLQVSSEPVLSMSGVVEFSWTEKEMKELPVTASEYTNKDDETTLYDGVSFADLLADAGVSDYEALTMLAADGYSADITSDELSVCPTCVVIFQDEGGLKAVMPGFSGKLQVKDLVELSVK